MPQINNIQINYITEYDTDGFRNVLDIIAREGKYLLWDKAPSIETTRQFVNNNIANNYPQFVAKDGDRIIGWCDIIPYSQALAKHRGIMGIGIIENYRNCGIGTKLINSATEHSRQIGLKKIELGVRQHNKTAIALYEKLGFIKEGIRANAVLFNNIFEDEILMAKNI